MAILTSLGVFGRIYFLVIATLRGARTQHLNMITKVMAAPINLFFDVTPIGKLLNRFSRDLQMLDESINYSIGSFLMYIYGALCSLVVAALAVHYILVIEFIYFCCIVYLFRKVLPAYKESFRINMIQFSPIVSFFQETIAGNTVLRAFNKEEESNERVIKLLNNNCLSNTLSTAIWCWYSIRVDILCALVLVSGGCSAVWLSSSSKVDPILLSLMLQYLLSLQDQCNYGL